MGTVVIIKSPEEAYGLARWGMRFAVGQGHSEVHILSARISPAHDADEIATLICQAEAEYEGEAPDIIIEDIASSDVRETILSRLRKDSPDLVILGKQRSVKARSLEAAFARDVFDHAPCSALLIRLGASDGKSCERVLVPTSGGPHARQALHLAVTVLDESGEVCPLLVEPNAGEYPEAVGQRILQDQIELARLSDLELERLNPQVVVHDHVTDGIRKVAEDLPCDLLLIGASNATRIRQSLFGTVPERLLQGDGSMAIGVIRRARPVSQRIRERVERFLHLSVPQLNRKDRVKLVERLQTGSVWNFDFMALMLLATGIAALGLIQNSTAVVIGAMLVAPLMTPLLGAGLSLVQGNLPLMRDCMRSIIYGFFAALVVGFLAGLIAPIGELTNELRSRGGPTVLDLGVAFFSGIAASYCVARSRLAGALAGVAIAAALVPPIATVGISLALREVGNALGATILFATNVVAIVLGAALTFFATGIRANSGTRNLWARRSIIGLFLAVAILVIPLASVFLTKVTTGSRSDSTIRKIVETQIAALDGAPDVMDVYQIHLQPSEEKQTPIRYVIVLEEEFIVSLKGFQNIRDEISRYLKERNLEESVGRFELDVRSQAP